ncbi:translation elongation factor Ts [Propionimicrobium sp. PCR01-08-3]|uniref:translation elongation factor Ts n=1 Tax=Propionimicrobium sp. PCR01-08-3 TaxID=3052086 RepID=UPI00255CEA1C|nr:translation elongation factor Ts [Propionimicrobium sp. PCR01-08-3]WIY81592.1 translation elongation factor Ts [Propionimicrobium sp. PCR01-08-3]
MAITAADVKKLRDLTGAGMMDAKKALTEAEGDFERATELLRVSGAAKVAKRSDRSANNGLVAAKGSSLIQLGSETDFVAKNQEFVSLASSIVDAVEAGKATDAEAAKVLPLNGGTVAEAISNLEATIGEKLELAHVAHFDGEVHTYLHRRSQDLPPQVGVLVEYEGDDTQFVHEVALQIASMRPDYVSIEDVPDEVVEREKRIATETALDEGKPEKIIPKIVEGRVHAFYKEACLLEQPSITDDKKTVGQLAKAANVTIKRFVRFVVGA